MILFLEILTPFLLASIGGLYSEISGFTNVALEGYLSLGGFLFILFSFLTGSLILGVIISLILVGILGFLQSFITVKIKGNSIITGLATNLGIAGFISVTSFHIFRTKGVVSLNIEKISSEPIIILALVLPFLTYIILKYTRFGLRLKARGFNKKVLIYSGISTLKYRVIPTAISGVFAAMGGIFLAMELRSYTPNLGGGRGWISLVIIFLGRKNPIGVIISSGVFSLAILFSNLLQKGGINSELILGTPYLITLVFLILSGKDLLPFKHFLGNNKGSRKKKESSRKC